MSVDWNMAQRRQREKRERRWQALVERDGTTCWICGKPLDMTLRGTNRGDAPSLDHVIERCLGGTGHLSNLKLGHRDCNSKRSLEVGRRFDPTITDLASAQGGAPEPPSTGQVA